MTVAYEDALHQVLDAVHAGLDVEMAVAHYPEHAAALRDDARLSEGLARLSQAVRSPTPETRAAASRRMLTQLAVARAAPPKAGWSFATLNGWPRYAVAAALVVIAVLGAGLLLDGDGATVEAATIEGVVVENQGGSLTVQTLDALERVRVPGDALVSDVAGASIGLGGIEPGQVVVIDLERRGRDVVAQRVQRFRESLEAWCTDDSARCRALTEGIEQAQRQCQRAPAACLVAFERLEALRLRASDSVQLEELKLRCRGGEAEACRLIVSFCLGHPGVCADLAPSLDPPVTDRPLLENRLRNLLVACDAGDDAACRQVAVGCDRFADLCPADIPVAPRPSSAPSTGPRPGISSGDSVPSSPTPRVGAPLDDTAAPTSPAGDATRPAETSTDDRVSTPGPRPTNASSDIAATPAPIVTEAPTTAPSDRPAGDRPR